MLDCEGVPHGVFSAKKTAHYKSHDAKEYVRPDPGHRLRGKQGRSNGHQPDPAYGDHQQGLTAGLVCKMPEKAEPTGLAAIVIE